MPDTRRFTSPSGVETLDLVQTTSAEGRRHGTSGERDARLPAFRVHRVECASRSPPTRTSRTADGGLRPDERSSRAGPKQDLDTPPAATRTSKRLKRESKRDEYPEYPQNTDTSGGDTESDEEGEAALLARLKIPKGRETDGITPPKDAPEENFFATGAAEEMA